jgi:thiosulfate/3-mercaptopyruvate sulfurtransferase
MLLDPHQLNEILNNKEVIVLDASSKNNELNTRIKGARPFNIANNFSNKTSSFPNTFPSSEQFEEEAKKLGINNDSRLVIYDNKGIYTSPRVWFMFKSMGFNNVYVLNGGLPEWIKNDFETEEISLNNYPLGNFIARFDETKLESIQSINNNIKTQDFILIDARSEGRFNGTSIEPRENIPSGHIKGSVNIPYTEVLKDGKFKPENELIKLFKILPLKKSQIVFSCGSGITACIVLFAFQLTSHKPFAIYDGSWTEWATIKLK